jgi:hypothetical protein
VTSKHLADLERTEEIDLNDATKDLSRNIVQAILRRVGVWRLIYTGVIYEHPGNPMVGKATAANIFDLSTVTDIGPKQCQTPGDTALEVGEVLRGYGIGPS